MTHVIIYLAKILTGSLPLRFGSARCGQSFGMKIGEEMMTRRIRKEKEGGGRRRKEGEKN